MKSLGAEARISRQIHFATLKALRHPKAVLTARLKSRPFKSEWGAAAARYVWAAGQPGAAVPTWDVLLRSHFVLPEPDQPRWGQRAQRTSRFLLRQRAGMPLRRRTFRRESRRHQASRYFSYMARDWRRVWG